MTKQAKAIVPLRWVGLAFTSGLIVSGALAWAVAFDNQRQSTLALAVVAKDLSREIRDRLTLYQYGLRGARGAIVTVGSDAITRTQFEAYSRSRNPDLEFPGARGFGFIRRVPVAEEEAFVARARADGWPDFSILFLSAHDDERYVIQYIEPVERNREAVGLDIASDRNRREAARAAVESGTVRLTAPITLVQASGDPLQSFLILMPIYKSITTPTTLGQRWAEAVGWAYAPLNMNEVLARVGINPAFFRLSLSDVTEGGGPQRFYRSSPGSSGDAPFPVILTHTGQEEYFGRRWQADLEASPAFRESLNLLDPSIVFALGLLVSVIGAAFAGVAAGSQRRALQIAMTRDRLATIVGISGDAIISESLDGNILTWNAAAQRLFGPSEAEAVGQSFAGLLVPVERRAEHAALCVSLARGRDSIARVETVLNRANGTRVDIALSISVLRDEAGAVAGFAHQMRDIGERKAAERRLASFNAHLEKLVAERTTELEGARHILRTVLDAVPALIGYWDKALTCRFANKAYAQWFGADPDHLIGMPVRSLLGETLYQDNQTHIEAALRGEVQVFERNIPRADGSGFAQSLVRYLPDVVEGKVRGFYVIAHDVSEVVQSRQRLAAALRENESLIRLLHEQLLYSMTDPDGVILEVNDELCRRLGYRPDELLGKTHRVFDSELHPEAFWEGLWTTIASGRSWRGEICNRAKDGRLLWMDSIIVPFLTESGKVGRYLALRIDITDRKAAEAERARITLLLESVLAAATTVSIVATDPWGTITIFNAGAERLLGYTAAEVVGRMSPLAFHDPTEVETLAQALRADHGVRVDAFRALITVAERDGADAREWTYHCKDGSLVPVTVIVTPIRDADGSLSGYLGIAQDIGPRKQAQADLLHSKQLAERANRAKSDFLANMSHEIRTPLNALLGLAHLLAHTPLSEAQKDLVAKTRIAGQGLLSIVNDILDFSRIEAGHLTLETRPFQLADVIDAVLAMASVQVGAKPLTLTSAIAPQTPPTLIGDAMRLRQILLNLVGNALKFTPKGEVRIEVESESEGSAPVILRFRVMDTGVGVHEDAVPRIFDAFTQADSSPTRSHGGSGLGLAICKRLVTLMEGEISVESRLGQGSTFTVRLPFGLPSDGGLLSAPLPSAPSAASLSGMKILIVDDNIINQDVARRILELEGATVSLANNGLTALTLLQEKPKDFDAILMDIQMPVMDGYEATRRLRGDLGLTDLPVIALTAGALTEERDQALTAGMNDFITKPFDIDYMIATLRRHVLARRLLLSP